MIYLNKALLENTNLNEVKIAKLDEESKGKVADKAITRLYTVIKKKTAELDVPDIESSMGDVTKVEGYKDFKESLSFLKKIADRSSNKELKQLVEDLMLSDEFLIKYKNYFRQGFSRNNTILKTCYISVVGCTFQLTAYAISNCVTFVNNGIMFEAKATPSSPKLRFNLAYKALRDILELHKKNKLEKNFKECLSLNEAVVTLTWMGLTLLLLSSIKQMIYMFLNTRIKLAEYLNTIKDFVELNQSNVRDPKIKTKQQKWVTRLEKMRDKIAIDQEVSSTRATDEIAEEDQEYLNIDMSQANNDLGIF